MDFSNISKGVSAGFNQPARSQDLEALAFGIESKKTKSNEEENSFDLLPKLPFGQESSTENLQMPKFDQIRSIRRLNMIQRKENKESAIQIQSRDIENSLKLQPQKRAYNFEELSEGSTEPDSPMCKKETLDSKKFKSNCYQIERQIKFLSLDEPLAH